LEIEVAATAGLTGNKTETMLAINKERLEKRKDDRQRECCIAGDSIQKRMQSDRSGAIFPQRLKFAIGSLDFLTQSPIPSFYPGWNFLEVLSGSIQAIFGVTVLLRCRILLEKL
jgi:hypothetical protein